MTTWITVCNTCKRDTWQEGTETTDGERLAALVEDAARDLGGVSVRQHSCLMGCAAACNVTIQAAGKLCYTLGKFDATPEVAEAIAQYAQLHAQSETGQVPYRTWPAEVKGHFVTRHPPLPDS
ncbi:DUF1636 domain-containing protein [Rhodobacteraceae bacterium SC52]|nr:DUF1636 domain-containing protein [Rhodobacteraceae bacterium SC52]